MPLHAELSLANVRILNFTSFYVGKSLYLKETSPPRFFLSLIRLSEIWLVGIDRRFDHVTELQLSSRVFTQLCFGPI